MPQLRPLFLPRGWSEGNIVELLGKFSSLEAPNLRCFVPQQLLQLRKYGFRKPPSTAMVMDGQATTETNGIPTLEVLQLRIQTGQLPF